MHTGTIPKKSETASSRPTQSPSYPVAAPSLSLPPHDAGHDSGVSPQQEAVLIGGETVVLLRDIVELRENDVDARIHINNGLRDLKYKAQHVAKTQEEFMRASEAYMNSIDPQTAVNRSAIHRLQQAWKLLLDMTSAAKGRQKVLEDTQNDLLVLENRLFMKEREFYGKVRGPTIEALDQAPSSAQPPTDDFTTVETSSTSTASTVSVAHDYYSKVGDINLLRERIFNFDSEHRRERLNRDVQHQEGKTLDPPNRVFLKQYFSQRDIMIRKYVTAKTKMEELREACRRQGVLVQPPELPLLDLSYSVDGPLNQQAGRVPKDELHHYTSNYYGHVDNQHHILHWRREVQQSSERDKSPPVPEDIENASMENASDLFRASKMQAWVDQPLEDYPALSSYDPVHPSTTSDSATTVTDTPEKFRRQRMAANQQQLGIFQPELPSRRYSSPHLPLSSPMIRLTEGVLDWKRKRDFVMPWESSVIDECAKSLNLPRNMEQFSQ